MLDDDKEEDSTITLSIVYTLNSIYGNNMTGTKASNSEIFDSLYQKMGNGSLTASSYELTFTEENKNIVYTFSGNWADKQKVTLRTGTYHVTGTSTAEGENIQEKCSLKFDETVVVNNESSTIVLNAKYNCSLIIFCDASIASISNNNGNNVVKPLFSFGNYFYAFIRTTLYDPSTKSSAFLTGVHTDNSNFKIYTGNLVFEIGKYYIFDNVSISFILPYMEEGNSTGESNEESEHSYVDLGLPSGTLWATCNIGANNPEEYGDYFGWGEIAPSEHYGWDYYKFGNYNSFTKYNTNDGLTQLELEDDAAYIIWGDSWRMPTHDEEVELSTYCNLEPFTLNGVDGYKFVGPNGNSIFFPFGGVVDPTDYSCVDNEPVRMGEGGWYWSSTMNSVGNSYASGICFWPSLTYYSDHERCDGHMIRPVKRQ